MKLKIFVLISCLFLLSGCYTNEIQSWQVKRASEICLERNGIDYMDYLWPNWYVTCNDGKNLKVFPKSSKK